MEFGSISTVETLDTGIVKTTQVKRLHGRVVDTIIHYQETVKFSHDSDALKSFIELLDQMDETRYDPEFKVILNQRTGRYDKGYRSWKERVK